MAAYEFVLALMEYTKPWVSDSKDTNWREFVKFITDPSRNKKQYANIIKRLKNAGYVKTQKMEKGEKILCA
jgi:hypothetical protein